MQKITMNDGTVFENRFMHMEELRKMKGSGT